MKQAQEVMSLQRTTSCTGGSYWPHSRKIIPAPSTNPNLVLRSSEDFTSELLIQKSSSKSQRCRHRTVSSLLRSLLGVFSYHVVGLPACKWLSIPTAGPDPLSIVTSTSYSLGRKVTGTLFGNRRGHVTFAVQEYPGSDPVLILELAMSTSALVKEMSSGLVRIALECEKALPAAGRRGSARPVKLFHEPVWTMFCNGRKCGYATNRACSESDWHVLRTVHRVSIGAGVIPVVDDVEGKNSEGELLYMRAKFERVVGSRDSEAFYMLNPDGNSGPELSIFLLRI